MTLAATTISDIVLSADEDDLARIIQAVKDRRKTLSAARASSVHYGMKARTSGLSPKYLNDLHGTVERGSGRGTNRAAIRLDEASTKALRWACQMNRGRFMVPEDVTEYLLDGIPMQCFVSA